MWTVLYSANRMLRFQVVEKLVEKCVEVDGEMANVACSNLCNIKLSILMEYCEALRKVR